MDDFCSISPLIEVSGSCQMGFPYSDSSIFGSILDGLKGDSGEGRDPRTSSEAKDPHPFSNEMEAGN